MFLPVVNADHEAGHLHVLGPSLAHSKENTRSRKSSADPQNDWNVDHVGEGYKCEAN
jgi:hypothetical protein